MSSSVMARYHDFARALIQGQASPHAASEGALHYRTLVRLQHRQALAQMFGPVMARLGASRFDVLVDGLRGSHPPRDPNPSRWARAFADHIASESGIALEIKEMAEYLATRIEVNLAPDDESDGVALAKVELRAFEHDPRVSAKAKDSQKRASPLVLAIHRDMDGYVRSHELDRDAISAWGLETGQTDRQALSAAGVDDACLSRGRARLLACGLLRGGVSHSWAFSPK